MDAQLLGSLAVFLQIIDEKGFVGMDVRLPDYLLKIALLGRTMQLCSI